MKREQIKSIPWYGTIIATATATATATAAAATQY